MLASERYCGHSEVRYAPTANEKKNYIGEAEKHAIRVYCEIGSRYISEGFFAKLELNHAKTVKGVTMSKINLLDRSVYELIAAGEVIEKPASVIKELVENSIDAGARHITVEIRGGGISYMRVTDDGCGISFEEVPTAFLRHATSKVGSADDLDSIFTLGFRGEALASVAAVSRVEVLTKQAESGFGTAYKIEGSVETSHERAGCPDGTTVVIRDLFYNTPARLKFLKKDVTEGNQVQSVIDKLALAHPDVSLRFIRDNKQIRLTSGDGDYYGAIHAVFGKQLAASLIAVDYSLGGIEIRGYTSSPLFTRANRSMQYFFVNGRYVRSVLCMSALEEGYRNSIMTGKFPACMLNIRLSPTEVDVNVSPSKTEVRFTSEKSVFDAVHYGIKNAILNADNTRKISLNEISPRKAAVVEKAAAVAPSHAAVADAAEALATKTMTFTAPDEEKSVSDKPVPSNGSLRLSSSAVKYATAPVESLYRQQLFADSSLAVAEKETEDGNEPEMANPFRYIGRSEASSERRKVDIIEPIERASELRVVGELMKTYIVCEVGDEVLLIDKHAAHERLRFEKLRRELVRHSQLLAESVIVQLSENEYSALSDNRDALAEVGIELILLDGMRAEVLALPTMLDERDPAALVEKLAAKFAENNVNAGGELFDDILHSIACKGAIKAHDITDITELEQLAREVFDDKTIRFCPHGRPVMVTLTKREIEKYFNRIV